MQRDRLFAFLLFSGAGSLDPFPGCGSGAEGGAAIAALHTLHTRVNLNGCGMEGYNKKRDWTKRTEMRCRHVLNSSPLLQFAAFSTPSSA